MMHVVCVLARLKEARCECVTGTLSTLPKTLRQGNTLRPFDVRATITTMFLTQVADDDDEVECLSEWRCISTRCCLTLGPLTDPARGEHCAHDAKCNYAALRALVGSVGRSKVCRA